MLQDYVSGNVFTGKYCVRIRCCQNGENCELHCNCLLLPERESVNVLCTYVTSRWQNVAEIKE